MAQAFTMMKALRTGIVSLAVATLVLAQSSNVTQCIPDYQWSINSRGQTPCLVGAFLESACGASTSVDQVPPGNHYIGPDLTRATPCLCNSVTYSLISACGGCQNRTFIDYATWIQNCVNVVKTTQYPDTIPNVTEVPSWAFLNISLTGNTFDPTAAEQEAERAAASPSSTTSTTDAFPQSTPPSSSTPAAPSSSPSTADSGGLSSGAIAGITIGILVFVITVLLLIFWATLRARKRRNHRSALLGAPFSSTGEKYHHGPSSLPPGHVHARSLSDPASIVTPYVYVSNTKVLCSIGNLCCFRTLRT
ncbi:hypothetical protein P691DRAFT_806804 [Macrolepiota fuliginosa MF-IS2]|uniref:Mid2 domain-containing protein n=1 Tax=Macrolepiota fuliginosa MF-IS2 TaxID=1400762 RepID=A0A9P5XPP3_9AGAR|nr:hypothetical protein P691DRAFT_806804 [Macrolepiota fuliginosa MF-IS2]